MLKIKNVFVNVKEYFLEKNSLVKSVGSLFSSAKKRKINSEMLLNLKKILLESDVGSVATKDIISRLSKSKYTEEEFSLENFKKILSEIIEDITNNNQDNISLNINDSSLTVFVVCGINGNGKTTTIAKIANLYTKIGKKVVLGACDTFRAAAQEQLSFWAEKINIDCVRGDKIGSDPASVAYKALEYALNNNADLLIIDTAGRLQTHENLMLELKKIISVLEKKLGRNIDEIIMCIEANTGQNAISQIACFNEKINISSIIVTKIDGSEKAGIIVAISHKFKDIKISYVGFGEKIDSIKEFSAKEFSDKLVGCK